MKNSIEFLTILFILILSSGCAQNRPWSNDNKTKIILKDSIRLYNYLHKVSDLPLFSFKRQLYLDSALAIAPQISQLWQQKAMPLFKHKKYEIGMPYLDSAVKYDNTHHWLEYRAFIKCIFQKSYREALQDFDAAIRQIGNSYVMDHTYEFYKGLCYLQLNKFDSAEYFITKCIEEELHDRNDAHHLHWFYLGIVHFEKENYEKAIYSLNSALKLYPQFADAQFYKAQCLKQRHQAKDAIELLLSAKQNLQKGYTVNEDNALYEVYPYQLNKFMLDSFIDYYQSTDQLNK